MTELKDFDFAPTAALLNWAFRVCRETAQGVNYQMVGGGNRKRTSDEKALVLQEAGRVVNFVDRKLPDVQRALLRFCFTRNDDGDAEQSRNYNKIHNWAWRQIVPPVDPEVCNGLSCVRILVPYEVRLRVYGMKSAYSMQNLGDFLDIDRVKFWRNYRAGWQEMVNAVWDQRTEAFASVDDYLQSLLGRREEWERDSRVVSEIAKYMSMPAPQQAAPSKAAC